MSSLSRLTFLGLPVTTWLPPSGLVSRVVVFLHGSGDTGGGVADWVGSLVTREEVGTNTAVLFPSAKLRPYTLSGQNKASVWHDREELSMEGREDTEGIKNMGQNVEQLLSEVEQCGVVRSGIALGGFSQGGHLALHAVFAQGVEVGAAFSVSAFLCDKTAVFSQSEVGRDVTPPLFMSCGGLDQMVPHTWVENTRDRLEQRGVKVTFSTRPGIGHELERKQMKQLFEWLGNNLKTH